MFSICSLIIFCVDHRLSDPLQYQSIVDAEWNIIYDKLDKCVRSGAKIILSRLAIGDLATQVYFNYMHKLACLDHNGCLFQYFADRDVFCAGRVTEDDLQRVAAATGGTVQTSVNNIIDEVSLNFFFYISFQCGLVMTNTKSFLYFDQFSLNPFLLISFLYASY